MQRGLFRSYNLKKFYSSFEKNFMSSADGKFGPLDPSITQGIGKMGDISKINKHGYVEEETVVYKGDALIGKMVPLQQNIS